MTGCVAVLAAVVLGVLIGERLGPGSAILATAAGVVLLGGALVLRGRWGVVLAAAGFLFLGGAVMQRSQHGLVVSPLTVPVEQRARVRVTGSLTTDPDGLPFTAWMLLRVDEVDGADGGGRTVLVRAGGDAASRLRVLAAGDRLSLTGTLEPLDGYDARYRWRHAVARLRVREVLAFTEPTSPVARIANALRRVVLRGTDGLPASERALLAGFLLGDTRSMSDELVTRFRAAGLSHLLAVSGANVAFVLAIVSPLLSRLGLAGRLAGGLAVLIVFGTMTRWEPSVLRASGMAALVMVAAFAGRPVAAARVLVLTITGILVVDPFLLHSVGFLLSCAASAGIVVLGPWLAARLPGPRPLREAAAVALAAQVAVAPVLVPVFGSVPLVALPANLLAGPVVGPLTVWGLGAGVAGGLTGGRFAALLQAPTFLMLRWVETVARLSAAAPLAVDGRAAILLGAGLSALGALGAAVRIRAGSLGDRGSRLRREGRGSGPAFPERAGAARPARR